MGDRSRGFLDAIPTAKVGPYQEALLSWLKAKRPEVLDGIRKEKALSGDLENKLKDALNEFAKTFVA